MSTYQLDDGLVEEFLDTLHESEDEMPSGRLGSELRKQLPLVAPTNVGAIVQTKDAVTGGYYLRWAHDNATHSPWVQIGNHEEPYRTDEIGRIVKVLSEGVDL